MTPPTARDPLTPDPITALLLEALARYGEITLALSPDLGGHCGVVDRENAVILLASDTSIGKRRATLAHELLHLVCPELDDDCIEARTADTLITQADAVAVTAGAATIADVADRACVDPQLVRAAIAGLELNQSAQAS